MFNQNIRRVGFACKINSEPGKANPNLNTKSTTITWLQANPTKAHKKLETLVEHNLETLYKQIEWVGRQDPAYRMFRISSDLLPAYTHQDYMPFYFSTDTVALLEREFMRCGELARKLDVRLSFHPGQFCVLASEHEHIRENSLMEFEYHADMIRYMGFGRHFQDFKCNVHIAGKLGPQGIKQAMRYLSPEARNTLTIENSETTWGLDASLELVDTCALVLDIHHHWVNTGMYISADDPKVEQVVKSWRGVRPVIHYSVSREDVLDGHSCDVKPDYTQLVSMGITRGKMRAHSDFYWNTACNQWAHSFSPKFDIMLESKEKNLAHKRFVENVKHIG